jgi:hypothetical protein
LAETIQKISGAGPEILEGGHAFKDWRDRFHEDQPDSIALHPNGTRDV